MCVAHLPFDFGPGGQCGDRVDDQDVERPGADQHVGDLECLLTCIRLRNQQIVDVDADGLGVDRVHGVLGVDVGADATVALRLGHHMHGQGRLTGGFRAEDLHDSASGESSDTEGEVECQRPGGDGLDVHVQVLTHPHDRALAELLLDLP